MRLRSICLLAATLTWGAGATGAPVADAASPALAGGAPAGMYRLSESQYRNTIADVFGADIAIPGRFEQVSRRPHGLLAPGSYLIAASPRGTEQYSQMARAIAAQVVDAKHRASLIGCAPQSADQAAQDDCATQFFGQIGRYLFRRSLTEAEVREHVRMAREAGRTAGDFYTGIALGLEAMLISPRFLFQIDALEADPGDTTRMRLTGLSRASRLSFFLWDTSPDEELLAAAARGDLNDAPGLARQVDRMLASPRAENGVRAFFTDMLQLERFDELSKDAILYPQFIPEIRKDVPEETLRTITGLLLSERRDYRELFTTRRTYVTPALAAIYGVQFDPAEKGWAAHEFPAGSPRAGILTRLAFLNAFSHPGRSSPTLRGQGVRELLLCQAVPDPPANVDFTEFEKSESSLKTVRDRLQAHRANPVCAGCHKITDPIGLALENFDTIGVYRTAENDATIDASASFDGVEVQDAAGLGEAIGASSAATSCLVNRLIEYGTREPPADATWTAQLHSRFAQAGYRLPDLLRVIATSDAFYRVSVTPPRTPAPST